MSLRSILIPAGAALIVLLPVAAGAIVDTENLAINATVGARAKLVLAPTTINFVDADPDVTPFIAADNAVNVLANVRTSAVGISTLTCVASGDLVAGGGTPDIPITSVAWTAAGAGYVGGTLDKAVAQNVGSWTGSGSNTGTLSYKFANSWAYNTGSYSQTVVYTLTSP